MNLRAFAGMTAFCSLGVLACGSEQNSSGPAVGVGGQVQGVGGSSSNASGGSNNQTTATSQTGGVSANGGAAASTGGSSSGVGGAATGGAAVSTGGSSVGGSSNTGGAATTGGSTATGGKATGGSTAGGSTATGGKATGGSTAGGSTVTGGKATGGSNVGGASIGGANTGGANTGGASRGGAAAGGGSSTGLANFSFFVASEAALIALSGNAKGFGGDLRYGESTGLAGADKICAAIAESSMPGSSAKQWRAFLSIAANGSEAAVNAIDRVGDHIYYDRLGRVVATGKAGLLPNAQGRPDGIASVVSDLPNETGTANHSPNGTQVDNHDTLTGSNTSGQLASTYANTCNNWTSAASATGRPVIGHSWTANSGTNWIQVGHTSGGCAPCNSPGESGCIGSMGGYGGFYCFALSP